MKGEPACRQRLDYRVNIVEIPIFSCFHNPWYKEYKVIGGYRGETLLYNHCNYLRFLVSCNITTSQ